MGWTSIQSQTERKIELISEDYLKKRFSDDDDEYKQFVEDIKEDIRLRLVQFARQIQNEVQKEQNLEDEIDPDA